MHPFFWSPRLSHSAGFFPLSVFTSLGLLFVFARMLSFSTPVSLSISLYFFSPFCHGYVKTSKAADYRFDSEEEYCAERSLESTCGLALVWLSCEHTSAQGLLLTRVDGSTQTLDHTHVSQTWPWSLSLMLEATLILFTLSLSGFSLESHTMVRLLSQIE